MRSLDTDPGAAAALAAGPAEDIAVLPSRLSDRTVSRFGMCRPCIVAGVVGVFVSLVVAGFAPSILVLLIAYGAAQLFSNFAQAAGTATLADQVPSARRGFVSGLVGAAGSAASLAAAFALARRASTSSAASSAPMSYSVWSAAAG